MILSLVIPAYNESHRLPPYLASVRAYLDSRYGSRYEVIVVDDGSSDGLAECLYARQADWPQLIVLQHTTNRGKGAAVRTGALASRGELVLYADADGATPIEEESRLAAAIRAGADVAIGSRIARSDDVQRERRLGRGLAGRLFAAVASWLLGLSVSDTQCGFKMFRGELGRRLFARLEETGYLFDLELLALARRGGHRIAEVPIHWTEIPGGHFRPGRTLPRIVYDLLLLRSRLRD